MHLLQTVFNKFSTEIFLFLFFLTTKTFFTVDIILCPHNLYITLRRDILSYMLFS